MIEHFTCYHDSFWLHSCSHGAGRLRRLGGRPKWLLQGCYGSTRAQCRAYAWHIHGHGIWSSCTHTFGLLRPYWSAASACCTFWCGRRPEMFRGLRTSRNLQRALKGGQVLRCSNLYVGIASPAHGIMQPKGTCSSE